MDKLALKLELALNYPKVNYSGVKLDFFLSIIFTLGVFFISTKFMPFEISKREQTNYLITWLLAITSDYRWLPVITNDYQ